MTIYKQIDHIINLINSTKKIIILILIIVNGLGFVYYKNLKKTYLADIIVTAIPNKIINNSVDIYTIFESYFRDPKNLENWIKLQKEQNGNKDVLINKDEILGYRVDEEKLYIYNRIVFRNAVTLQRSIYLTIPGEDPKVLKNIFLYAIYIGELLNNLELAPDKGIFDIYSVLNNLKINFNFNLESELEQKILIDKYFRIIQGLEKELEFLNSNLEAETETRVLELVKITPPQNIYTNSINSNKVYFSTTLLSIFLIFIVLIYKDFRKSTRKSVKLDK